MAIKMNIIKCPQCEASLPIEEGREQIFCSYCGARVILTNENEYIYRHVDEASIKKAENDRLINMRKIEMAEKRQASAEKIKKLKVIISIILGIFAIICFILGFGGSFMGLALPGMMCMMVIMLMWIGNGNNQNEDDILDLDDRIRVPSSISGFQSKNYAVIESIFASAGFTNIRCIPMRDLTVGVFKKPGLVDSITIDGHETTSGGSKFSPDASVIITYHSFSER